jgi:glycogen(starch) synthase
MANQQIAITHDLWNQDDEVLNQLRAMKLVNLPEDPVKVVYHPDFISGTSPLFGIEYDQFVRGCHLGLFPSYYEPWGYTPLECLARGIPAVASDLSGFGSYVVNNFNDYQNRGLYVIKRKNVSYNHSAEELTNTLMQFLKQDLRERIAIRFKAQEFAEHFDWLNLVKYYHSAYKMALEKI